MTDHHVTHHAGYTADGDHVWRCLICGREITTGKHGVLILNPGDPNATHSGGIGGLSIGGVEAEDADWLAAWMRWVARGGE